MNNFKLLQFLKLLLKGVSLASLLFFSGLFVNEASAQTCTVRARYQNGGGNLGEVRPITAFVDSSGGTVDRVEFTSSVVTVATVTPSSVSSSPYVANVVGVGYGNTRIYIDVYMNGVIVCDNRSNPHVYTIGIYATPVCNLSPPSGGHLINMSNNAWDIVRADSDVYNAEFGPFSTNIPAGDYRVTLESYDNHSEGDGDPDQLLEQYSLQLNLAGGGTLSTGINDDIGNNENYRTTVVNNSLTIPSDISSVTAKHAHYRYGISNSLVPLCAVFEPATSVPAMPDCLIYSINDASINDSQLFSIDPANGYSLNTVGGLQAGYDIEGIDIHPITKKLYGVSGGNNEHGMSGWLFNIEPATGAITPIGPSGSTKLYGLSFRPNGELWASSSNNVHRLDIATGARTAMFSIPTDIEGLAWNPSGTLLYLVDDDEPSSTLMVYNPLTNSLSTVDFNFPEHTGALEFRPDGLLMAAYGTVGTTSGPNVTIIAYDVATKSVVSTENVPTTYYDVESVTWPDGCGFPITPTIASCTMGDISPVDGSTTLVVNSTKEYDAIINSIVPSGSVDSIKLVSSDDTIATIDAPDTQTVTSGSPSFTARYKVTGNNPGITNLKAEVYSGTDLICGTDLSGSPPGVVEVVAALPWWQAMGGDVIAKGAVQSIVPTTCILNPSCSEVIIDTDINGFPGILIHKGILNKGSGEVSNEPPPAGWYARTEYTWDDSQNYSYFTSKFVGSVVFAPVGPSLDGNTLLTTGTEHKGFYIFKYDGGGVDLHITGPDIDLGDRKVVLLVESGDVYVDTKITFTKGKGLFVLIANNDIIVDGAVGGPFESPNPIPDLNGIFFANGQFKTSVGNTQLHIRGSVAGLGIVGGVPGVKDGILFERDLGSDNAIIPSTLFEFAPDMLLIFPPFLSQRFIRWAETNP